MLSKGEHGFSQCGQQLTIVNRVLVAIYIRIYLISGEKNEDILISASESPGREEVNSGEKHKRGQLRGHRLE
jgi:hypothetical protein